MRIVEARSYTRENGAGMRLLVNDRSIFLHSLHNHYRTVVTRLPIVLEIDWRLLARRRRKIWGFVDCCHTFSFVICWICGSLFPSVHRRSGFGPPSAAGAHPRSGFRPPSAAGGTPPMGTPPDLTCSAGHPPRSSARSGGNPPDEDAMPFGTV